MRSKAMQGGSNIKKSREALFRKTKLEGGHLMLLCMQKVSLNTSVICEPKQTERKRHTSPAEPTSYFAHRHGAYMESKS